MSWSSLKTHYLLNAWGTGSLDTKYRGKSADIPWAQECAWNQSMAAHGP